MKSRSISKHVVAAALAASVALATGCTGALERALRSPRVQVNVTFVHTGDGWDLEMRHYRVDLMDHSRAPVILCHGMSCNASFWDVDSAVSFAEFLAEAGYDVWVPSLRGAGGSTKPGFSVVRELITLKLPTFESPARVATIVDPTKWNWTFDDYVHRDLPVLIEHVRKSTGHDRVVWIGHSMGGMAMYAYLETEHPEHVESFVSLACPIVIPQPTHALYREAVRNRDLLRLGQIFINASLSSAVGVITGVQIRDYLYYERSNISPIVLRVFLRNGIDDVPTGVLDQLMEVAQTGQLKSHDGKVNYSERLKEITTPILVLAGQVDNMAPLDGVREAFEQVGSADKTFHVFGLANFCSADYGHMDLVIGRHSRTDVFPYVLKWLETHDGRKIGAQ